jgi:3-hydroxyisobutyrate dehydrogenase
MITGFLGTGLMGEPMATRLARSGVPLLVWNRTPAKAANVIAAGARMAESREAFFQQCDVIVMMLATADAIDEVLARNAADFGSRVTDRLIINTGTVSPEYSSGLAAAITAAGGRFVEAPVSGSRRQAENGELVVMAAGEPNDVEQARTSLAPLCTALFNCGAAPNGLRMKLAVNLFLIVMVTGLVEAFDFASEAGIDLNLFRDVLAATPMASSVSRVKADKLARHDLTPQAAITDVLQNARLILDAARALGLAPRLIEACGRLYAEAADTDLGALDMIGVRRVLERQRGAIPR